MDGCPFAALIPTPQQVELAVAIAVPVIHFAARLWIILTHTPAPGSPGARIYILIELVALEVGRAKETGELPATPQLDHALDNALADAIALVRKAET
jgi:hypothetical protein